MTQRAVNRTAMFLAEPDYRCFLRALLWASERSACAIHAYVLMSNHVHLLLTPSLAGSPARMMQSIGALFVQYMNQRYKRTGALWERRYRSSVVSSERYLLACIRYIELNPVRAEMVGHPGDYPWSSYHRNAGGRPDSLITPHPVYQALGQTDGGRLAAYRSLLEQRLQEPELEALRAALRTGAILRGHTGDAVGAIPNRPETGSQASPSLTSILANPVTAP